MFESGWKDAEEVKKIILAIVLLLSSTGYSQTQFDNGNKLKQSCESGAISESYCLGYIIGVADSNVLSICAPGGPGGVTKGQFLSIVKKYFNDNPAQLHRDADVLVLDALKKAFPCPKK